MSGAPSAGDRRGARFGLCPADLGPLVLLAGLLAAGCGEEGVDPDGPPQPPAAGDARGADRGPEAGAPSDAGAEVEAGPADVLPLALGLGPGPFTPAAPGATALLQRGCQGAQHLTLSVYSAALAAGEHRVTLSLARAADGQSVVPPYTLALDWSPAEAGAQLLGLTLVVFDPLPIIDTEADVAVQVEAADGRTGSATLRVRVAWGPDAC